MRFSAVVAAIGLLTACSQRDRIGNEPEADIHAAAEAAQGDIDTYAANALQPAPRAALPVPAKPPEPVPSTSAAPVEPTPAVSDQPAEAGNNAADDASATTAGVTVAERGRRPRAASLEPRPAATAAARTVGYRCAGETRLSVRFDGADDSATVHSDGRDPVKLEGQRPASGIWYRGNGYELRGKGRDADYAAPGRDPVGCTADR